MSRPEKSRRTRSLAYSIDKWIDRASSQVENNKNTSKSLLLITIKYNNKNDCCYLVFNNSINQWKFIWFDFKFDVNLLNQTEYFDRWFDPVRSNSAELSTGSLLSMLSNATWHMFLGYVQHLLISTQEGNRNISAAPTTATIIIRGYRGAVLSTPMATVQLRSVAEQVHFKYNAFGFHSIPALLSSNRIWWAKRNGLHWNCSENTSKKKCGKRGYLTRLNRAVPPRNLRTFFFLIY